MQAITSSFAATATTGLALQEQSSLSSLAEATTKAVGIVGNLRNKKSSRRLSFTLLIVQVHHHLFLAIWLPSIGIGMPGNLIDYMKIS